MKILILSISAGNGHEKAAQAIKDYMEGSIQNVSVNIVDALKYISPIIDKIVIEGYLYAVRNNPSIYSRMYTASDSEDTLSYVNRIVYDMLSQRIKALVDEYRPDVIISTHPFHLEMISSLKKKYDFNIPVIALITDFSIHNLWVRDFVDAYIIPHEDIRSELVLKGIHMDRIYPYGIPVGTQFLKEMDKKPILDELGLLSKPTILIIGGSLGLGSIKDVFSSLIDFHEDIQIIAMTGHNTSLKKSIEGMVKCSSKKIKVFQYTEKMPEIMHISSMIITKPGGLIISEAMAMGLPIGVTSPVPGQEEKNCSYVINSGIGVKIEKDEDMAEKILSLVNNHFWVDQVKSRMYERSKPQAVNDIANLLMSYEKLSMPFNSEEQ